jgi:hypothetical protein
MVYVVTFMALSEPYSFEVGSVLGFFFVEDTQGRSSRFRQRHGIKHE